MAPTYQPGQRFWLSSRNFALQSSSHKLAPRFICPHVIDKFINPSYVCFRLLAALCIHPSFHVSQIKPVKESPLCTQSPAPPPAHIVDGAPTLTDSRVLVVRCRGWGCQFLGELEGYAPEERSWISHFLILDPYLIMNFY